jgi:putative ABC transport system substrate-binding protein
MRRREFMTLVGGAVAAWPLTALGKTPRIAVVIAAFPVTVISETTADDPGGLFPALFKELRRLGYVEGQNLLVERYSAEGRPSHYADLAREVVSRNSDVILTVGDNNLTLAFKAATATIPIVGFFNVPVETGIVTSLARPEGNITGFSGSVGPEQWGKRIQLLQQIVPQASRFAYLQTRPIREQYGPKEGEWGVSWVGPPLNVPADEAEYRRVFTATVQDGAAGITVDEEEINIAHLKLIVELAEQVRLPAIYPMKMFVEAGGLMSYGIDIPAIGRGIADIVGQILKGAKPADIPIRQPTKFELVINLKTAKALGLTVPATLLATRDEIIE